MVWQASLVFWQRMFAYLLASAGWIVAGTGYNVLIKQINGLEAVASVTEDFTWSFILFWMALGGTSVFRFYQCFRLSEQETLALMLKNAHLDSQLTQMQLQTLKAQLHPHFLFNVHNAIAALVRKGDRKMALKMLAALSDLLRHTLSNDHAQYVTLRAELDFLQRYLDLEQIRFQGGLRVDIDVDEDAQEVLVPNMILQQLVENAIRHGIAEPVETGQLRVSGKREKDQLHLEVWPPSTRGLARGAARGYRIEQHARTTEKALRKSISVRNEQREQSGSPGKGEFSR